MRTPLLALLLLAAGCAATTDPTRVHAVAESAGTGFRVGPEHLLTAAHVVAGCGTLWAVDEGRGPAPAQVALIEPELDVAVLRSVPSTAPSARLAAASPLPGTDLLATGFPGAERYGAAQQVPFRAILLPLPRPEERMALRGTARPGMSGSPLVDGSGEVAGMLLARGDPMAPGSLALGERLGVPVADLAVMVPASWLRAMASLAGVPDPTAPATQKAPAVSRIVCAATSPVS